jgi:hypothetical protein
MADHVGKDYGNDVHVEKAITPLDDTANLDAKAEAAQYKLAAIEAETAEHDMGVMQAIKEYPMAAWWAFVMSCTIVRHSIAPDSFLRITAANLISRSWRHTASSLWVVSSPCPRSRKHSACTAL